MNYEYPEPVVIKKNVTIPPLLENFVNFGFECIKTDPTFGNKCTAHGSLDTKFKIFYRKEIANAPSRVVNVKLGNRHAHNFWPGFVSNTNRRTHINQPAKISQAIKNSFNEASRHVKSVECAGPFIDYLLQTQTVEYLSIKMVIVVYEMLVMNKGGVDAGLFEFMTKYNSGLVQAVARHAQKPKEASDGFKIAWHRDTNRSNNNVHKGMVTTGLYIHRSNEVKADSGGISFSKDSKEVRIFPAPKTVVTFLDQHIVHKVIPVRLNHALTAHNHGFVQRSAVFMSWHTTKELINKYAITNLNKGIFLKAGITYRFRNLKKLYLLLNTYFRFIRNKHALSNNIPRFINTAPNNKIVAAYQGHGLNARNYSAILSEGQYPANTRLPVANLILYKMKNSPSNSTPRKKLKNLTKVYTELQKVFGNVGAGAGRTNKVSQLVRRGGRTQHTVASSGFIKNIV
jgi:hypothetical protein